MGYWNRTFNLVLSGGGVKGISFAGAYEVAENKGVKLGNIAGVSAGALAGSLLGAGYKSEELKKILFEFDFQNVQFSDISKRLPIVARYLKNQLSYERKEENDLELFLTSQLGYVPLYRYTDGIDESKYRAGFFKNIATFSKEGCLLDGDYLEEWVSRMLRNKGVTTFGDLKGGIKDKVNPNGYKVRMTAVDLNRAKIVVLPDDISFYGIIPDKLEVAKAVRMSTCVPFAFKPVEIKKWEGKKLKTYNMVDGGLLDGMPFWLVESSQNIPGIGFRIKDQVKKLLNIDTPLGVLKGIVKVLHDTGVPKNIQKTIYTAEIDTSKVEFLDFILSSEEKNYLYQAGKNAAAKIFTSAFQGTGARGLRIVLGRLLGRTNF